MNTGGLILVIGSLLAATGSFLFLAFRLGGGGVKKGGEQNVDDAARQDVEHIFDDDFNLPSPCSGDPG